MVVITSDDWTNTVADAGGKGEDRPVLCVFLKRDLVGENDPYNHIETGTAQPLKAATEQKDWERMGGSAGTNSATDHHDDNSGLQGRMPSKYVSQLAPEWNEGSRCEIESRNNPIELRDLA